MDEVLLSLFKHTKLDDKQRRVYLALLQLGKASVSQIAEAAELKRTNVYTIVEELEVIGYVHRVVNSKKKIYSAADPGKIVGELKQSTKTFEEMLPYLKAVQRRNSHKPYAEYYSGLEGVKQAFSQIYKPKDARYLTSIDRAQEVIPDEVARWQKAYLSGKATPGGHHILTNTKADRSFGEVLEKSGQPTFYLDPNISLGIDVVLADDRVFLTSFEEDVHVTIIHSEAIYKSLCALYDLAWSYLASFKK